MKKRKPYHKRGVPVEGYWPIMTHPLYLTWALIVQRCENKNSTAYPRYGGRGIKMCQRWRESFADFVADMGPKASPDLTIERKNNDGNYEPGNCVWATRSEQCFNRRTFKNNTTGARGVVKVKDRFTARFDYENQKYELGRFASLQEAKDARAKFEALFFKDRESAIASISSPTLWCTSSSGVRGIVPHADGRGYVVRVTLNKVRHYVGYFTNLDVAKKARDSFVEEQTRNSEKRIVGSNDASRYR
jgi:hypothetical protein